MNNICFFLIIIFPSITCLTCLINCHHFTLKDNESFQNPIPSINGCQSDQQAKLCYGQIMIYYPDDWYPELFKYSFGQQNHIIEKETEYIIKNKNFQLLIYFLFLTESYNNDYDEFIITIHIICQINDNCALKYIKDFFYFYSNQKDPSYNLRSILNTNAIRTKNFSCYDYENKKIQECLITKYSTCFFSNKNLFQQGCYSNKKLKIEYIFILKLFEKYSIEKIHELIICNKENCNNLLIRNIIENIIYNYTFRPFISFYNNGNKLKYYFILFYFLQILFYDI